MYLAVFIPRRLCTVSAHYIELDQYNLDYLHYSATGDDFFLREGPKVVIKKGLAHHFAKITQVRSYSHTSQRRFRLPHRPASHRASAPPSTLNLHLDQVSRHINNSINLRNPSRWYETQCSQSMRFVNLEKSPLLPIQHTTTIPSINTIASASKL